jgi:hypothetical protein
MRQFKNDDFQFSLEGVLGYTYRGLADVGEALTTAGRIKDGDADAWVHEWRTTAERVERAADAAYDDGRRVSALAHYRRAATYYSTALYVIAYSSHPERHLEIWRRSRVCWERVVDLSPVPGQRLAIPYESGMLPGWFFPAPDAQPGERRPTIVVNNGSDGATSAMWGHGGAAAHERGYHWMTFDGPGQQSALFEQGIPFRPDWEAVLTPVTDTLLSRSDIDPERIAVIGISQAGYWVPRALAFEHRFAAAVVDPGVVDVYASWASSIPGTLRKELDAGKQDAFDRNMRMGERFSSDARGAMEFRGRPYGVAGGSRYELFKTVRGYRLDDEVAQITTPLLVTDPDDEQFWPGQSQQLYDRLTGERELVRFTAEEGANRHCEPMAIALRDTRIFDWLDGKLAGAGSRSAGF